MMLPWYKSKVYRHVIIIGLVANTCVMSTVEIFTKLVKICIMLIVKIIPPECVSYIRCGKTCLVWKFCF